MSLIQHLYGDVGMLEKGRRENSAHREGAGTIYSETEEAWRPVSILLSPGT